MAGKALGSTRLRGRKFVLAAVLGGLLCCGSSANAAERELRVCADPNNLPFSNQRGEGFENRIVEVLARELEARVSYVWWAQRRGFFRNTLKAGLCDLVAGAPAGMEMLLTTAPYYRSTYAFVTRARDPEVASFDDPRLRTMKIGVQLIGDDGANPPPVAALAQRGIIGNLKGYPVYGDYAMPNPPARIVEAVARGEIDVALVWGPLAGYFAAEDGARLRVTPVPASEGGANLPMAYDISMGVRRKDEAFRDEIEAALVKHRPEIDAILAAYHVPRTDPVSTAGQ
ncbi:substrate-binding domain-containing protein [Pseudaminobacter sp. 19-2017]|uniref:Substrate-binding domain-containing protein n=2 Tax=Pseudaminobacter soli (ex Zhang et al. 2022) TaxID=2831468 RepID=A0A942E3G1_9HYPH|nr:substrate-binding domain-containing protein [Pseudaminobacter soli]